jgi:hypothetical protein
MADAMQQLRDLKSFYAQSQAMTDDEIFSSLSSSNFRTSFSDTTQESDEIPETPKKETGRLTLAARRGKSHLSPISVNVPWCQFKVQSQSQDEFQDFPSAFLGTSLTCPRNFSDIMNNAQEQTLDLQTMINDLRNRCSSVKNANAISPNDRLNSFSSPIDNMANNGAWTTTTRSLSIVSDLSDEWAFTKQLDPVDFGLIRPGNTAELSAQIPMTSPPTVPLPPLPSHGRPVSTTQRQSIKSILKPSRPRKSVRFAVPEDGRDRENMAGRDMLLDSLWLDDFFSPSELSIRHAPPSETARIFGHSCEPFAQPTPTRPTRGSLSRHPIPKPPRTFCQPSNEKGPIRPVHANTRAARVVLPSRATRKSIGRSAPNSNSPRMGSVKRVPIPTVVPILTATNTSIQARAQGKENSIRAADRASSDSKHLYAPFLDLGEAGSRRFTLESVRSRTISTKSAKLGLRTVLSAIPKAKQLTKRIKA